MAVVQISRIQLRRGRANETPIPQLASGELAWAIDTQELWIGNGAVGEGAPAVGNTRVLTEADAPTLLDVIDYTYKNNTAPIQTGASANFPVVRPVQDKLDEYVSIADYGVEPSGVDQSAAIQRAIDNLFLDNSASTDEASRVTLEFPAGRYYFTSTIYLPSYVTITGAGKHKTELVYGGSDVAFEFVNDTSTKTVRSLIGSTTYNNQPRFCKLSEFTLTAENELLSYGFKLNAVRDSTFDNVEIIGYGITAAFSNAIGMHALSSVVTCQRNTFSNVTINGFKYCVFAKQDIFNNHFNGCEFIYSDRGISFGEGADLSSTGEQFGPRKNTIDNCYFNIISKEGILVSNGTGNRTTGNTFDDVGGSNTNNLYNQIKFVAAGNSSTHDNFDRAFRTDADGSSIVDTSLSYQFSETYLSEVGGKVQFADNEPRTRAVASSPSSYTNLFRIPVSASAGIEINYVLESSAYPQMRRGKMTVAVDLNASSIQLVDEYDYVGTAGEDSNIIFGADLTSGCIVIKHKNTNTTDSSTITYTYKIIS